MVGLIYTCIEVPITLSFNINLHLNSSLGVMALFIDLLLLFDCCINFRTAYFDKYDRLKLISNQYDITKKYLTSWFLIDLLSSLPYQLMDGNNDNPNAHLTFGLLRSFKILRLIKMIRIFNKFTKTIVSREVKSIIKLAKLLLSMLLFAHFSACLWYFIGYHNVINDNGEPQETW